MRANIFNGAVLRPYHVLYHHQQDLRGLDANRFIG
jgi:hypothetical protein